MIIIVMKHVCYISIGSNLGNRIINCKIAMRKLQHFATIVQASSFYETEPWGYEDNQDYINAVLKLETLLSAENLLSELHNIEIVMGRKPKHKNVTYESRVIDLDILFFDDLIINQDKLIIPHPKLYNRQYVLRPFLDIDPNFICPATNKTIKDIISKCQDTSSICLYTH